VRVAYLWKVGKKEGNGNVGDSRKIKNPIASPKRWERVRGSHLGSKGRGKRLFETYASFAGRIQKPRWSYRAWFDLAGALRIWGNRAK